MYKLRKSARGIVLNSRGEMAVQHIQKFNYHKLPGGGMEDGELIEETFCREILEEVGCVCEIIRPIGVVNEYHDEFLHISYGFSARMVGSTGESKLEADEIENEQTTIWMSPDKFVCLLREDVVKNPKGLFMAKRDLSFMAEYFESI